MKNTRLYLYFLTAIFIIISCTVAFSGCTSGEGSTITVPEFEVIGPPPVEVTIEQLYTDYVANEAAANAKYKEEKLLFYRIEVEEVVGNYFQMAEALGVGDYSYVKLYFINGAMKFKLRENYFGIMQNIEEGYILNIIGECEGLREGFIIIDDCWVESVVGDLGTNEELDFY